MEINLLHCMFFSVIRSYKPLVKPTPREAGHTRHPTLYKDYRRMLVDGPYCKLFATPFYIKHKNKRKYAKTKGVKAGSFHRFIQFRLLNLNNSSLDDNF